MPSSAPRLKDTHYRILKLLEDKPKITQRELARALGVSVGKANYCLKMLLEKGWIETSNFRTRQNKLAYSYYLTPTGASGKAMITMQFLKNKLAEYEVIKKEIAELESELVDTASVQHSANE